MKLNAQNFEDQKKRKQWIYLSSNKTDGLTAKLNVSVVVLYSEVCLDYLNFRRKELH